MDTDWTLHLKVKHDGRGHCTERGDCPNEGFVLTVEGPALADDPNRQWTEPEIDRGDPWH